MQTVKTIFDYLCELAPVELQMDFDNAGRLVGHSDASVSRALLALDITEEVIREAVDRQAQLIISHHPVIWGKLSSITDEGAGKKLLLLAENRLSAICMHTNLDIVQGGVNDVLMDTLGIQALSPLDADGCGRIGELPTEIPLQDFLALCKDALQANGLRYCDAGRPVKRVAVMGGAGADAIGDAAAAGCDTYVTADIKYHQFQLAFELGLNLIDADHFFTENPVIPVLAEKLRLRFPDVDFLVSERHRALISFY